MYVYIIKQVQHSTAQYSAQVQKQLTIHDCGQASRPAREQKGNHGDFRDLSHKHSAHDEVHDHGQQAKEQAHQGDGEHPSFAAGVGREDALATLQGGQANGAEDRQSDPGGKASGVGIVRVDFHGHSGRAAAAVRRRGILVVVGHCSLTPQRLLWLH